MIRKLCIGMWWMLFGIFTLIFLFNIPNIVNANYQLLYHNLTNSYYWNFFLSGFYSKNEGTVVGTFFVNSAIVIILFVYWMLFHKFVGRRLLNILKEHIKQYINKNVVYSATFVDCAVNPDIVSRWHTVLDTHMFYDTNKFIRFILSIVGIVWVAVSIFLWISYKLFAITIYIITSIIGIFVFLFAYLMFMRAVRGVRDFAEGK